MTDAYTTQALLDQSQTDYPGCRRGIMNCRSTVCGCLNESRPHPDFVTARAAILRQKAGAETLCPLSVAARGLAEASHTALANGQLDLAHDLAFLSSRLSRESSEAQGEEGALLCGLDRALCRGPSWDEFWLTVGVLVCAFVGIMWLTRPFV